jgi:hypothetical protein
MRTAKKEPTTSTQYQAKLAKDGLVVRGKIPSPLLKEMGARPGDYVIFRLATTGEAIMRLSHKKVVRPKLDFIHF